MENSESDGKQTEQPGSSKKQQSTDEAPLLKRRTYEWGWLDADQFMKRLEQEGIKDASRSTGNSGSIIHLVCASDNQNRKMVGSLLTEGPRV